MASWARGKCIGRGSFGKVSLAFDRRNGSVFAVKSVDISSSLSYHLESLENEIRILRSLSSPYVVKSYGDDTTREGDMSNTATSCYRNLHMEYLPGGTVADVAALRGGKLSEVDERSLRSHVWCVVSALHHVHSRGIVHCDVKGRNVLVGEYPQVAKLADFGSAVEFGRGPPRGSPLWMAPEVVRGECQGPESDVWSLGCTVIEMVTGKPAWEDRGVETLNRIGFSDALPEFPTELSPLGRDFLEKCLSRDPRQRWSCDQLLQHPFIANSSPVGSAAMDSSPRCVLDWVNSKFESDHSEGEEEDCISNWDSNCGNDDVSFRERIDELSTSGGAKWESDGWVVVRKTVACESEWDEVERASSEYTNFMRRESESESGTAGTSLDCSNTLGAKVENSRACLKYSNSSFGWSHGDGSEIGLPLQLGSLAVITKDMGQFHGLCNFLLFLYYVFITVSRNNNNILHLFIYTMLSLLFESVVSRCFNIIYECEGK